MQSSAAAPLVGQSIFPSVYFSKVYFFNNNKITNIFVKTVSFQILLFGVNCNNIAMYCSSAVGCPVYLSRGNFQMHIFQVYFSTTKKFKHKLLDSLQYSAAGPSAALLHLLECQVYQIKSHKTWTGRFISKLLFRLHCSATIHNYKH